MTCALDLSRFFLALFMFVTRFLGFVRRCFCETLFMFCETLFMFYVCERLLIALFFNGGGTLHDSRRFLQLFCSVLFCTIRG